MQILIVMDMQQGLFAVPRYDSDAVVTNICALIAAVREQGGVVIHIRHNGLAGDGVQKGTDGWQFLPVIDVRPRDLVIEKTTCDAFYGTDLEKHLREAEPDSIIICGCCTDFCVDTTVKAAVNRNFPVIVPSDAHTTADRPHMDGALVVTHHNWCWENLITPGYSVRVDTTANILAGAAAS